VHLAVLRETNELERRVSITPNGVARLIASGHHVLVEAGAGETAGFADHDYTKAGATITDRDQAVRGSAVVTCIDGHRSRDQAGGALGSDHAVIAMLDPLWRAEETATLAETGATLIALELIPRITRAQSMDVLSSTATVAGSQAVLLGALECPKMMPLMMTAAGTVPAARVLVLGAGVAGLQAIATARRLGGLVEGYDIRPAAAEQIRSLGAKAVELAIDTIDRGDDGGYAREQDDETAARLQSLLADHVARADLVVTTAAIPGAASPILVTDEMVRSMRRGSVIVDMAAERGGNCALTVRDDRIDADGVLILGPTDLPSRAATTASEMFSTNVVNLIEHLCDDDGDLRLDPDDEITAGIVVADGGSITMARVQEKLP
jgi:NAD(P) transhydrogenase subunit alpha